MPATSTKKFEGKSVETTRKHDYTKDIERLGQQRFTINVQNIF